MSVLVVKPDAHPETSSVDGYAARTAADSTWDDLHGGDGTGSPDAGATLKAYIRGRPAGALWWVIERAILLFDARALPDDCVITAATLTVFINYWAKIGMPGTAINIFSSDPTFPTSIVNADYQCFGSTPLATAIPYFDPGAGAWVTFTLTPAGRAAISKTDITKLAIRESKYDAPDIEPPWESNAQSNVGMRSADRPDYEPYLTITYQDFMVPPDPGGSFMVKAEAEDSTGFTAYVDDIILVKNVP